MKESPARLEPVSWKDYHESTKHSLESLRRTRHFLDWKNMPDPFRHYEGVPVLDLPADPPAPEIPALAVLQGQPGGTAAANGTAFLSQLLFYSAAISAAKRVPSTGYRYALRVNPSSGNLHPTEFHFAARGLRDWPDGLYHYRPSSHMAEQRAAGAFAFPWEDPGLRVPLVFVVTSIAWREAWKYHDRAYRYCLHDIGHAWQALVLAAQAMGCGASALGHFPDDAVAQTLRLAGDEWPMLLIPVRGPSLPWRAPRPDALSEPGLDEVAWFGGKPNALSVEVVDYPSIRGIHAATKLDVETGPIAMSAPGPSGSGSIVMPPPAQSGLSFGEVARTRRSALDFEGGTRSVSLAQLSALLDAASRPCAADFAAARFIQLYLYVHRVEGLAPGVYRHWPESGALELVRQGDQRVAAAGLSLGQDLAGNACMAFSMIADLERATLAHGDRGYRYAHFEAGAIGQRLYMGAEALGLRATGIGAFYDDRVHNYLDLAPGQGQVIYHFAIGHAVPDPRLEA